MGRKRIYTDEERKARAYAYKREYKRRKSIEKFGTPEERTKREENRRAQVVRDRCRGFEFAGNYTGSDGTADIRCTVCGTITTRSWCSIKQGSVTCRTCDERKAKELAEKREQKKQEERKRNAVRVEFIRQARIKQKQATLRECKECDSWFVSYNLRERYCSVECATKHANRVGKDRRLDRIDHTDADMDIDWKPLYKREHGICYLCGKPVDVDDYEWRDGTFIAGNLYPSVDHVVALHNGGTHTWDNVRLAHRWCNSVKH